MLSADIYIYIYIYIHIYCILNSPVVVIMTDKRLQTLYDIVKPAFFVPVSLVLGG